MTYYLFYSYGSCQDGSHSCAMQSFANKEYADSCFEELQPKVVAEGGLIVLIEGNVSKGNILLDFADEDMVSSDPEMK